MSGGSFGNPQGAPLSAMQQSLFAQMDSMRRTSVGVQDIFANRMMGASPYGGGGQMAGAAGDTMFRLNQSLEKLTQQFTKSPMMTGQSMYGGAGISAGQMLAASMGMSVQAQGMPGGQIGTQLGRRMFAENVELGLERFGRGMATQMLPGVIGAGASLLRGGALWGPMAGAAAEAVAPMALRGLGLDADLQRGAIARQFRMDLGDRLGGTGAGRIAQSFAMGNKLAGGMTDYIKNQQQQYQAGALNFGLNAEEYAPLQQAMTGMMGGRDLKRLTEGGAKVIKEQMDALVGVSATLNMTFKETAELAQQFGQAEGGAGALSRYVNTIEAAAARGGVGMSRGLAIQFGLGMRTQARQLGLQGETVAGQVVQDVGVLQSMINQTAGQRMLSHDQMAAFGGNSEQERIQNMVQSMFQAGATIAQGPVGAMIRGNLLAGNPGMQGGMLGMMGTAGGQFARDPFGFVVSQADPTINQQVQTRSLFTYMGMLEESFVNLDPNAAAAAFISKAGSLGMSKTQAGAVQQFYQKNRKTALQIAQQAGGGANVGRVMSAAFGMADSMGMSQSWALDQMSSKGVTLAEAEGRAAGIFGFSGTSSMVFAEADIEASVKEAGDLAARVAEDGLDQATLDKMLATRGGPVIKGLGTLASGTYDLWTRELFGSSDTEDARTKAMAATRQMMEHANQMAYSSEAGLAFVNQNREIMRQAGVTFNSKGDLTGASFSGFDISGMGGSKEYSAVVRSLSKGGNFTAAAQALRESDDETGFQTLLTTIGALSASERGKKAVQDLGLSGVLADRILTEEEFGQKDVAGKLSKFMAQMGGGAASFLAINAVKPMITEASVMQSIMRESRDYLEEISKNTKEK